MSSKGDILVVQSKVREYIKSKGDMNIGGDVFESVSAKVAMVLDMACDRAKANGRKTVQGKDV